jgi:DDE family transposase
MARKQRARKQAEERRRLTNKESFDKLRLWLLPDDGIFSRIKLHGNIKWAPTCLVWLALCWAWSEARNLTEAFAEALGMCQRLLACTPLSTYQGFMGALVRWSARLLPVLRDVLQQRMAEMGSRFWCIDAWVPIAFDGSRSTAPRTKSNEAAFCAPNYGKGKTAKYRKKKSKGLRRRRNEKNQGHAPEPQAWITLLWHMGLRLPWSWRLGPSNSSERAHVMDMLQAERFPPKTLFCGDAGFVGYPLWACVLEQKRDFLVRVGANVSLLHEYACCTFQKKEKELFVLCWPRTVMQANQPPLRLRLLQVRVGKAKVWMLTSVLPCAKLTSKAAVRFYKLRWGIEMEFRGLKQTLNRGKLRCRNDRRLLAELDWSILAMAVAELMALKEQQPRRSAKCASHERPPDPKKRSLAKTMRALRMCLRQLNEAPEFGQDLLSQLRAAVTDSYQRRATKTARYRPPNTDKKPLGDPKLRRLGKREEHKLREIEAKTAA